MNEYSDISFLANLDPFAKKKSKNDLLKVIQKGHPIVSPQEPLSNDSIVELASFAQHKKYTGPKWMSDVSKWSSKHPEFSKIFELKLLQVVEEGVVDMTLLMSIFEAIFFEGKFTRDEVTKTFVSDFISDCGQLNGSIHQYLGWDSNSIFSSFVVINFEVANFITLKDNSTQEIYHVYDNLGFSTLKIGQNLVCRIVPFHSNFTFTGGFVLVIEKGYCTRYHKDGNLGNMFSNGIGTKILKESLDFSSNYNLIYSYYRIEREAISETSFYNGLTFDEAFSELNYLIIKHGLKDQLNLSELSERLENNLIGFEYIKSLKKKLLKNFYDYSDYSEFFIVLSVCVKKHPRFIKEKMNLSNNLIYGSQLWDDIQDISLGEKDLNLVKDDIDLKASRELLNINRDPILNYNKSVDLVISKRSPIISLKMVVNSYRASENLSDDLLQRWYLTMSLNLINIGEIVFAKKYFEKAKKLGAEVSRYQNYVQNELYIDERKLIGRNIRFNNLIWGNLITNLLNKSIIVTLSKSFLLNIINGETINLNSKGKFKNLDIGNILCNKIMADAFPYSTQNPNHFSSFEDVYPLKIVYELLLSSGLIQVKDKTIRITALGKIYFYTKLDADIFELLFVTWLKHANWNKFVKGRKTKNFEKIILHLRSNIYRLFNFMYSKGTSSFSLKEAISVLSVEYIENENEIIQSKLKKSRLWEKVFVKSVYEVLQLYGIMNIQLGYEENFDGLSFKLTDDGIYLLGKIESEIDRMIPLLVKKIIL